MYTDRAVFKGSPAQFYAVIEEYELDSKLSGMFFFIDLVSPTREIVLSHTSPHPILNNYKHDYVSKVSDLNHLSPRCVVNITTESKNFDITAVITADQKTRITALARDEEYFEGIKHIWKGFLGYAENLGWIEKETLVQEDERKVCLDDYPEAVQRIEVRTQPRVQTEQLDWYRQSNVTEPSGTKDFTEEKKIIAVSVLPADSTQLSFKNRYHLSDREWEVFKLWGEGLEEKVIADRLCVRVTTVKSHKKGAAKKIECDPRRLREKYRDLVDDEKHSYPK